MVIGAILKKRLLKRGVCEVGAVPSEQVIHSMGDREGKMGRIQRRFRGKLQELDDGLGERLDTRQDFKFGDVCHYFQPFCGGRCVPLGDFRPHRDGRVEAEVDSFAIPPIHRELLMGRHGLPSATAGRQVAGTGGFDVNGFHFCSGLAGCGCSGGFYLSRFTLLAESGWVKAEILKR